jgi:hypothetical protein
MKFKKTLLFFGLFFLIAIPFYFFVILIPVSKFNNFMSQAPVEVGNSIDKYYPKDLIIDIRNGEISINQKTPYCLIIDSASRKGILFDENAGPLSLGNNQVTTSSGSCNPVVVVGKNFVVYPDIQSGVKGAYKVQTFPSTVNFEITLDEISQLSLTILPQILQIVKYAYYIVPFVLSLLILGVYLLKNFWYALVAKMVTKWTKINPVITYKEAYSKSFFILFVYTVFEMTFIELIINNLLHLGFSLSFPFLATIIVTLGTVLMEKYYYKKKQPLQPPTAINNEQPKVSNLPAGGGVVQI